MSNSRPASVAIFAVIFVAASIAFMAISHAGYPMIGGLSNQEISINGQTDVLHFTVTDDLTPADQLVVTYRSDNPSLVPADDNHIILGGSGSDRTVQVIPLEGASGIVDITIYVKDTDNEMNYDTFEVDVTRPPSI